MYLLKSLPEIPETNMLTVVDHHPNYGGEKKQTFESTNHCLMLCHYFTLGHFFFCHPC
jgi:hypothetical protein